MRFETAIEHLVDNYRYAKSKVWIRDEVAWALYHTWKEADDRKTEPSNSEKPNNCEHITEDGVTCAKYPACDDCLDNPLNKVKGSERSLKGKDEPQRDCFLCKWLGDVDVCGRCRNRNLFAEADTEPKPKDEPQKWETPPKFEHKGDITTCVSVPMALVEDEPQTDCAWK